ncbi:MAG: A24 family peptidase [Salinarimonas sp.]
MNTILTILILAAPALLILAAIYDVFTMTIPNKISLALIALFAIVAPFVGMDWWTALMHVGAGVMVLTIGIGLFAMGWVGGGDVKLAAATSLWIGFGLMLDYFLIVAIAGGLLTLAIIILRRLPLPDAARRQEWLSRLYNPTNGVPYGVALAAAAIIVLPESSAWESLALL